MNSQQHLSASGWFSGLRQRVAAQWLRLQPREQRGALIAGAVVGLGLIWTMHEWQRDELARLDRVLPRAEQRVAQARAMADEVVQLQRGGKPLTPATVEWVLTSLPGQVAGLAGQAEGPARVRVQGEAAFDQWVSWVAELAGNGWRVAQAQIDRVQPGRAKIEAVLERSGGPA